MRKRDILKNLEEALEATRMEKAGFGDICSNKTVTLEESEVTDFIRERTLLYRRTWIIYRLERAIEIIKESK